MFVKYRISLVFLLALVGGRAAASANTISGRVTNQTVARAAAGDDVILLRLGEGMQEVERTRTDAQGIFSFSANGSDADYIVRVLHQGVNYDQKLSGSSLRQEITVYDAVAKIPGLVGTMGIVQVESDGANLKVTEMYAIGNASNPPVTQSSAHNFEMSLPARAALDSFQVKRAGGVWVNATPSPLTGMKGRYAVDFPLRPGDTLFRFVYHLPYHTGTALKVQPAYPVKSFGVVHPPSMVFKSSRPKAFSSPGVVQGLQLEQLVSSGLIREVPAFELSGVGLAPPPQLAHATPPLGRAAALSAAVPAQMVPPTKREEKPGREFWAILSIMTAFLTAGVVFVVRRRRRPSKTVAANDIEDDSSVINAIRDELSQLETEKLYGVISPEEYETAKQAVSVSLERALTRTRN